MSDAICVPPAALAQGVITMPPSAVYAAQRLEDVAGKAAINAVQDFKGDGVDVQITCTYEIV